jgi:hypothetical protein
MFAEAKVVTEVPADRHPKIVGAPDAVDVTVQMELRNLAVGTVPLGKSTPMRSTFDEDDRFAVKFSARQLEPIVRRVTFDDTFSR